MILSETSHRGFPLMGLDDPRVLTTHLLRRAGFGATAEEIQHYSAMGFEGAVQTLLNPERVPDDVDDRLAQQRIDMSAPGGIQMAWLFRMLHTRRPLQEK